MKINNFKKIMEKIDEENGGEGLILQITLKSGQKFIGIMSYDIDSSLIKITDVLTEFTDNYCEIEEISSISVKI